MSKTMYLLAGALLLAYGLSGTASASSCLSVNATFGGSIGSTTTCGDYNNMAGCVIAAGQSSCSFTGSSGCTFTVTTTAPVGSTNSTQYTVTPDSTCDVKMAFTQGNQGANYCQYIYPVASPGDTLTTLGNKGEPVGQKQLEVCTDQVTVVVSSPIVILDKRVVRVLDGGDPDAACFDTANADGFSAEASDDIQVIASEDPVTEVAYCYTITNKGQDSLEAPTIIDDNATPDDTADDFVLTCQDKDSGAPLSFLPGNDYCVASQIVEVTTAGKRVNSATASGTVDGVSCGDNCEDTDSTTVTAAVECDPVTQNQADTTGTVIESRGLKGTSRCGPKTATAASVGLLCDSSCELRPECGGDPINFPGGKPSLCAQPCKASGNWTYGDNIVGTPPSIDPLSCVAASPTPGKLPLCQEVLTNPANNPDCSVIKNATQLYNDGHAAASGWNPLLYYFPASGGGNDVGTIYCITYPGEDPSLVCPKGSIVY